MKPDLEKPAVNISKLTGGKNEKARWGALKKKLRLDLYFVYRKYWMENKITEYVICVQQAEVISGFLFTFITHKLWERLEFLLFRNTYLK